METERMKRLSEISSYQEIKSPSAAIRRGMHCPLFGCTLLMQQLEKTVTVIIGTEECGFYSKEILKVVRPEYMESPVYCYALEEEDIVFGCEKRLLALLAEIQEKEQPEAIFLISTCVTELIGEDMQGLVRKAENTVSAEIFYVDADNFKQNSHIDGMSDMLAALAGKMRPFYGERYGVNLLGDREAGLRETELGRYLKRRGIPIQAILPGEMSLEALQKAERAKLNVVLDATGLKLAKRMEKLGIPYLIFGKYASADRILQCYRNLEECLGLSPAPEWELEAKRTKEAWKRIAAVPDAKKRLIYANSPLISFDTCILLHQMGFEILACFVISYNDMERELFAELKASGMNPFMALLTDFARTEELNETLRPGLYIGRGYEENMRRLGITMLSPDQKIRENGFALSRLVAENFCRACGLDGKEEF